MVTACNQVTSYLKSLVPQSLKESGIAGAGAAASVALANPIPLCLALGFNAFTRKAPASPVQARGVRRAAAPRFRAANWREQFKSAATDVLRNRPKSLQTVLRTLRLATSMSDLKTRLSQLSQSKTGAFLDPDAYDRALVALDKFFDDQSCKREYQGYFATWSLGGRRAASAKNGEIFSQTLRQVKHRPELRAEKPVVIPKTTPVRARQRYRTEIEVQNVSTFRAAQLLVTQSREKYNPLVLDMANAYSVCGAPDRASAQEETLARQSNLFASLNTLGTGGRSFHPTVSAAMKEGGILVPKTTFFRNDPQFGYAFVKPFRCDVFASAAFNCNRDHKGPYGYDKPRHGYEEGTEEKMRAMFRTAIRNGNDSLVLGAFGCGAFKNSTDDMTSFYKEVLSEPEFKGAFKKIVFAVIDGGGSQNFPAFQRAFRGFQAY